MIYLSFFAWVLYCTHYCIILYYLILFAFIHLPIIVGYGLGDSQVLPPLSPGAASRAAKCAVEEPPKGAAGGRSGWVVAHRSHSEPIPHIFCMLIRSVISGVDTFWHRLDSRWPMAIESHMHGKGRIIGFWVSWVPEDEKPLGPRALSTYDEKHWWINISWINPAAYSLLIFISTMTPNQYPNNRPRHEDPSRNCISMYFVRNYTWYTWQPSRLPISMARTSQETWSIEVFLHLSQVPIIFVLM